MNPAMKRFNKRYLATANAIASANLDQEDRERLANDLTKSHEGESDFKPELFRLLASDPLVPCAGHGNEPCPHGRVIRIPMHDHMAEDGRSTQWRQRAPYGEIRCISCGSAERFGSVQS